MYFKRLELLGFKSFMDKTVLNFEPGVTAVVGPNGCGKSNIFDSIRWVLGEQSIKSLRGAQMEDVIFNGTDNRQGLGMAEVSLTFDNKERHFSVESDDVVITRRVFRSGESEYLLNRAQVRLKDILELLMGTGIGAESYSIVAQGKIDLILSSKPEERRMVFDEAAGITKYKTQKKEALRRLEDTEQNLLRLNDIILEVQRSIGHLERQANKARRYKELFDELKGKDIRLSLRQHRELVLEKENFRAAISELELQEEAVKNEIGEEELRIEKLNAQLKAQESEINCVRENIAAFENLISRDKQNIDFNNERIKELRSAMENLLLQQEETEAKIVSDEEKLAGLKKEFDGIHKSIEEKSAQLVEKEGELEEIVDSIKGSLESIVEAKKKMMEFAAKISHAKNEMSELSSKQHVFLARQKRLELEKMKVEEEHNSVGLNMQSLTSEMEKIEAQLKGVTSELGSLKEYCESENNALSKINSQIDALEKAKITLESQREFLEKLKLQYEGIDTAMNAVVYLDKVPDYRPSGLVLKVKDYLKLEELDKVAFSQAGFKLSAEAKPIDLDTTRVLEKISGIEAQIVVLREESSFKSARITEFTKRITVLQEREQEVQLALGNKRTFYQAVLEQMTKINEEQEVIALEIGDVSRELSSLGLKIGEAEKNFRVYEEEHRSNDESIRELEALVDSKGARKEEVMVGIARMKAELESLNKRLESDGVAVKMLEDTCQKDRQSLENTRKQIAGSRSRQESLAVEVLELEEKISSTRSSIAQNKEVLAGLEDGCRGFSADISAAAAEMEEKRAKIDGFKESIYKLQMEDKEFDYKLMSISERISQVYKADLGSFLQDAADDQGIDSLTLSQEIEKLRSKLDSYGNVNLVAIEEYEELKKRYDFLSQQQNDLLTAKASLQEAIQKINRTTRKMFVETFEKVREEFKGYFRMLFNGGDAQIFLVDENDPLETGIEIICRPPGKKLQNVLLLSGGEKSLSAIALIFAIFKVKPAPFCILDEIDAALDEANVDRFARMLQDFSNTSQFIVITHNKRTIANADIMYGITMEESGVSKIVSVKFASSKQSRKEDAEPVAA